MSWMTDIRKHIASVTASQSGGLFVFRATGAYQAGEVGIYGQVMPETPDEAISMTVYGVSESSDTILNVQFMLRASSESRLDEFEDAVSNCWSWAWNSKLNDTTIVGSSLSSGAALGQDSNNRVRKSLNYRMIVDRPLTHRT